MPTYVLEGDGEARIAMGVVSVQVNAPESTGGFVLTAMAAGPGNPKPSKDASQSGDTLVVPDTSSPTTISIAPAKGTLVFPPGSVLNLTISLVGSKLSDPDRILMTDIDVSGLSVQNLVQLDQRGGSIVARSRVNVGSGAPLTGLALRAQSAARGILGADTVDAQSALNVVLAVDGSASMLGATRRGEVDALLDVMVGVSRVIAPDRSVRAALLSDDLAWVDAKNDRDIPANVAAQQASSPLGTGFRSAHAALTGSSTGQNTMVYLFTDAVPADLDALKLADEVSGEGKHLVIFGDGDAFSLEGDPGIAATLIGPVAEEGVRGRLELSDDDLRRIITSLLKGCFVKGTDFEKRVSS